MKKYFSLASALMLALSMGMTSCSNDLDEVQAPAEQQPEMHKLHLTATAPDSPETRAYVEGSASSDAFTITGWKEGDKLYGIYQNVTNSEDESNIIGEPAAVEFIFNGTEFESEDVPATITNDKILYFIHGEGSLGGNMKLNYKSSRWSIDFRFLPTEFAQTINVDSHFTDIMMFGKASLNGGGNLTANMQLPRYMGFICLHNDSESPITAKLFEIIGSKDYYITESFLGINSSCQYNVSRDLDSNKALVAEIPAYGKAYLPVKETTNTFKVEVNGNEIAEKAGGVTAGKVYKLTYPSSKFVAK